MDSIMIALSNLECLNVLQLDLHTGAIPPTQIPTVFTPHRPAAIFNSLTTLHVKITRSDQAYNYETQADNRHLFLYMCAFPKLRGLHAMLMHTSTGPAKLNEKIPADDGHDIAEWDDSYTFLKSILAHNSLSKVLILRVEYDGVFWEENGVNVVHRMLGRMPELMTLAIAGPLLDLSVCLQHCQCPSIPRIVSLETQLPLHPDHLKVLISLFSPNPKGPLLMQIETDPQFYQNLSLTKAEEEICWTMIARNNQTQGGVIADGPVL